VKVIVVALNLLHQIDILRLLMKWAYKQTQEQSASGLGELVCGPA